MNAAPDVWVLTEIVPTEPDDVVGVFATEALALDRLDLMTTDLQCKRVAVNGVAGWIRTDGIRHGCEHAYLIERFTLIGDPRP